MTDKEFVNLQRQLLNLIHSQRTDKTVRFFIFCIILLDETA